MTRQTEVSLDGIRPGIVYYSGQPTQQQELEVNGWNRHLDVQYGAFYYEKNSVRETKVWDTAVFWEPMAVEEEESEGDAQDQSHVEKGDQGQMDEEMGDIYGLE